VARASRLVATIRRDVPVELDLTGVTWGRYDDSEVLSAFTDLAFTSLVPRLFALRASSAEGARPVGGTTPEGQTAAGWRRIEGAEADAWVAQLVASPPGSWVGVASGVGGEECLFPEERALAVAHDGASASLRGEAAATAWETVLAACRVSAGDVKAMLEGFCPPGSSTQQLESAAATADPSRLFDCGIAGYLLASNRSDYGVAALAAEHLSRHVEPGDTAEEARAAAELAPVSRCRPHRLGCA